MASSYFKSAPLGLFNSNLISTVLSVGLHGLALFLLLPYVTNLPTSEPEVSESGEINVPVIELNPNEQNRLPEQNSGVSAVPEFPNSSLGDLPMLDSPSLGSSLPNNFSNLPTPPALPPLPPLNSYNNYNRIPIALPPRRSFNPPSSPISRTPLPPPSLQTPTPKTPPVPVPNLENAETPNPRQALNFGDPTPRKPNNPLFQGPNNQNPSTNNPSITRNPNNNPDRQQQIIRNLLQDTLKGAENLTYNAQGTTKEEARDRDLEWMQQTGVTLKPTQMKTVRGNYPKAACNLKLEGSAIYNVVVNSNGQLSKPPFITQSSGYGLFNNQGLQQVRALSFPQSTRVKVIFRYDSKICGTGVVEKDTNTQTQPSPTPAPQAPQNQAPSVPTEPKSPAPNPENSTTPTPKTPTEPKPPVEASPIPQAPQNQAPSAPTEPKSPAPNPENSTAPTPKPPTEPKPRVDPSPIPETPKNQAPSAPVEPSPNSGSPSTPKLNGTVAPPAGRK